MEIRLNRAAFLAELAPMQGIVERRTTIPVLSHILLSAEGDQLRIAATDLDVSLVSSCEAEIGGEGGIAVQARKFVEIVRSLVDDEIQLVLEDEKRLAIEAGRSRFKINGLPPEDFPTLPQVEAEGAVEIPFSLLGRMISRVLFAVSSEESRFQLNGALLKLEDGGVQMVATDGYRLALIDNELEGAKETEGVLVPRKALQELQRLEGEGSVAFRRGEHHLSFSSASGRRELVCRILEGTFPDYDRVIAKDNDKETIFDRQALSAAVQRVSLLTGDRTRAVKFHFEEGKAVISAANPDLGEAVEEVPCEYAGDPFWLGVNPDYVAHFLAAVDGEKVRLELKDEKSQCVGFPVDGVDRRYLCVIMPMRV